MTYPHIQGTISEVALRILRRNKAGMIGCEQSGLLDLGTF